MKNKNISFNNMFKDDLKDPEFVALAEKEELKAQIADFLVEERKEKNLTQAELSKKAKVSLRTINSAEKGNGNISIETFLKLAEALGKHVSLNFY